MNKKIMKGAVCLLDKQTDNTINQNHQEFTDGKNKRRIISKAKRFVKKVPWSECLSIMDLALKTGKDVSPFAAKAVYAGTGYFGKASTGTPIKLLHGIAKDNAIHACLGHGSLASGGKGIEGGKATLDTIQGAIEIGVPVCAAVFESICIFRTK